MLFDLNYSAMGVPPQESFDLAYHEELSPGQYLEVNEPSD